DGAEGLGVAALRPSDQVGRRQGDIVDARVLHDPSSASCASTDAKSRAKVPVRESALGAALLSRADAARARHLAGAAARALADEGVGPRLLRRAGLQPAQGLHLGLDAGLGLLLQR